ncbi:biotin/lipoyl-binding protein [uncultured Thiodictyon sp.]|uniref:HlyD family efflux transporter periplasmic adaptor subunit n=1 Tax=uncultured Thiodictyon sp. TaxID=1846217 RepID=UPI0025D3D958|nr:biotin/lipoyl-binding protein [uncultured Thiodictyon sp.]
MADAAPPATAVEAPVANAAVTPPARRRFTGTILFGLLVAAIAMHILVDQFTPYSSEATVQAPVIGVAPNISGTIVEVAVEDNQVVRANDPLFTIDPERFAAAVAAAQAALADAGQQVGASTAGIGTAEAKLSEAQAHLIDTREQYARTLEMVRRNVLPKAQGDTAKSQLASAEAGLMRRVGWAWIRFVAFARFGY